MATADRAGRDGDGNKDEEVWLAQLGLFLLDPSNVQSLQAVLAPPTPHLLCSPLRCEAAGLGGPARRLDPGPRRQVAAPEEERLQEEEDGGPAEGWWKSLWEEEVAADDHASWSRSRTPYTPAHSLDW